MSEYAQISSALQVKISSIPDIYNVVLKWPYTANIDERETEWRDPNNKLHLWHISRRSQSSTPQISQTQRAGLWVVRGIFGVNEAENSETVFQDLIDSVMNEIDSEINLVADFAYVSKPAELLDFLTDDQQVGILAHSCLITVTITSLAEFKC